MNRPPMRTMLLGHPIVVGLASLGSGLSLFALFKDGHSWPAPVIAALCMRQVMASHERVIAYQNWKAAWDAMGGELPAKGKGKRITAVLLAVGGLTASVLLLTGADGYIHPAIGPVLVLAGALFAIVALVKLGSKLRRNRPVAKAAPVSVCVGKPLYSVPDLRGAYRALPDYAQSVLGTKP